MSEQILNFINGEFSAAQGGAWLDNVNPATGQVVAQVANSGEQDVARAVAAAKAALPGWRGVSIRKRADIVSAVALAIEERLPELAALESRDTGKPIGLATNVDIPRAVDNFRFFANAATARPEESHPMGNAVNYTVRKPMGVCALITPWNLPLYLLTWKTAPALMMGNTIVAKPSEMTPSTASALAEIMHKAGLPKGVFNVVHGEGPNTGAPLVAHQDVSAVSFTGGTQTGKAVGRAAGEGIKKVSLELGGKNATVVFADCDFDKTVAGTLRAAFTNQGEVCLCGSRILVERSIYDRFRDALVEGVAQYAPGNPTELDTKMGALISKAHMDKVMGYIASAREDGGRILCGGKAATLPDPNEQGYFVLPTIVEGLAPTCRTAREEIFGPVVTLHPFDTEAEALEIANSTEYGLSASVWTSNVQRAHAFSAQLDVGMVWVNTWLHRHLGVPFGGVKQSGVGREGGRYSLDFFSQQMNLCIHTGESP